MGYRSVTKLGDPLGKACSVPTGIQPGIIVADLVRLRLNHYNIDKKWLVHAINSPEIATQLKLLTKGSTRPRVNLSQIRSLYLELPPIPEQHRIVAKIEQLFFVLDKGVAELKKARETLALYRQSLLKAAFEGRLTEKWRREHANQLETGNQLLDRIRKERDNRYKEQLKDWGKAVYEWETFGKKSKRPTKPRKPKKTILFSVKDLETLPTLPVSWKWVTLGELVSGKERSMQSGPFGIGAGQTPRRCHPQAGA